MYIINRTVRLLATKTSQAISENGDNLTLRFFTGRFSTVAAELGHRVILYNVSILLYELDWSTSLFTLKEGVVDDRAFSLPPITNCNV